MHRQRRYYRDKLHTYHEGQKVWLFTPPSGEGVRRKLHRGYTGPWTIKGRINLTTYELEPADGWTWRASLVVSCDRLKPYFTPAEQLSPYEPDPDLDPADYECRGNESLETLDRALPAPPSHRGQRGKQKVDDEDEEEEEYPGGRGGALQGPRPRRGHPPGHYKCPIIHTRDAHYFLMQEVPFCRSYSRKCTLTRNTLPFYCRVYDHQTVVAPDITFNNPIALSAEDCREYHQRKENHIKTIPETEKN